MILPRAALLLAFLLAADPTPKATPLFDGKSLDGWKATDFTHPGPVKVDPAAGTLLLAAGNPMTGVTTTRPNLPTTAYELSFEARRLEGSDFFAACTFPVGKSFLTLVNGGWGGGVTGLSSLNGSDASENETNHSFQYLNKTWYAFRIIVTDHVVRVAVDGKELITLDHRDLELATRIESRRSQPLGFASYRSSSEVRRITIRPLSSPEIKAADILPGDPPCGPAPSAPPASTTTSTPAGRAAPTPKALKTPRS